MNNLKSLIAILKEIEEVCLGDEIVNEFQIKIYDDRLGYVNVNVDKFGVDVDWSEYGEE